MQGLGRRTFLRGLLGAGALSLAGATRARAEAGRRSRLSPAATWPGASRTSGATSRSSTTPGTAAPPTTRTGTISTGGRRSTLARALPAAARGRTTSAPRAVLEQHARWIRRAAWVRSRSPGGVGDPGPDQRVHLVMDVLQGPRPQGHVRPGAVRGRPRPALRGRRVVPAARVRREAPLRRVPACRPTRTDRAGPCFKGFRTIVPESQTDCRGAPVAGRLSTPDDVWRAADRPHPADAARRVRPGHAAGRLRALFVRTPASGFDGIRIYDNFIGPEQLSGRRGRGLAGGARSSR